jgi:hypothetical protein
MCSGTLEAVYGPVSHEGGASRESLPSGDEPGRVEASAAATVEARNVGDVKRLAARRRLPSRELNARGE